MTNEEIEKAFNEIHDMDMVELDKIVYDGIVDGSVHSVNYAFFNPIRHLKDIFKDLGIEDRFRPGMTEKEANVEINCALRKKEDHLRKVCEREFDEPEIKAKIMQMVKDNPNVLKNSLEIVQLVAPAVAQTLGGIPALAIVGTILILIKQGILNRFIETE